MVKQLKRNTKWYTRKQSWKAASVPDISSTTLKILIFKKRLAQNWMRMIVFNLIDVKKIIFWLIFRGKFEQNTKINFSSETVKSKEHKESNSSEKYDFQKNRFPTDFEEVITKKRFCFIFNFLKFLPSGTFSCLEQKTNHWEFPFHLVGKSRSFPDDTPPSCSSVLYN